MRAELFCSRDCSFAYKTNENHPQWIGESASYSAAHKWMAKNFKKANSCVNCGGNQPRTEWANISSKYKRTFSDWVELCSSCHRFFDRNAESRAVMIEKFTGKKAELLNG